MNWPGYCHFGSYSISAIWTVMVWSSSPLEINWLPKIKANTVIWEVCFKKRYFYLKNNTANFTHTHVCFTEMCERWKLVTFKTIKWFIGINGMLRSKSDLELKSFKHKLQSGICMSWNLKRLFVGLILGKSASNCSSLCFKRL